jgi:hypothetical protein
VEASILTGSFREALYNLLTLFVIVAENKNVFLVFGIFSNIRLISLSKSMLSNLSASSKTYKSLHLKITKYLRFLRWKPLVFSRWYKIFPGVPMIT